MKLTRTELASGLKRVGTEMNGDWICRGNEIDQDWVSLGTKISRGWNELGLNLSWYWSCTGLSFPGTEMSRDWICPGKEFSGNEISGTEIDQEWVCGTEFSGTETMGMKHTTTSVFWHFTVSWPNKNPSLQGEEPKETHCCFSSYLSHFSAKWAKQGVKRNFRPLPTNSQKWNFYESQPLSQHLSISQKSQNLSARKMMTLLLIIESTVVT